MRSPRRRIVASCVVALVAAVARAASAESQPSNPADAAARVVALRIDREIEPVMAEYIDDGIDAANRDGAALIVIAIDTPGGLDTSMRSIIQHIVESNSPVAVYVTPSGSRAASAGFFILLAAD